MSRLNRLSAHSWRNLGILKDKNSMRCHHVFDEVSNQKILIPGCWDVVHSNDISDCTCYPKKLPNPENVELKELRAENKYLREELNKTVTILQKLLGNSV